MKRVGILPALVTLANGGCGLVAIYKIDDQKFEAAALLIILAMVFDVFDGLVARRAGITSRFGAHLDSLSDAISFGVAPAFLVKVVVEQSDRDLYGPKLLTVLTAIYAMCALIRLARYNVEHGGEAEGESQGVSTFAGMPTPGAAGVIASLVFLQQDRAALLDYDFLLVILPLLCALLGYLMVSRVPYVHVGTRFLKGRRDFIYLFFAVVFIIFAVRYPNEVAALGFVSYGFSGPAIMVLRARRRPPGSGRSEPPDEIPDRI